MTRRSIAFLLLSLALAVCFLAHPARAESETSPGPFERIHVIDFEGAIDSLTRAYVRRSVEAAVAAGADCIVLRIDSPGGTVVDSQAIGDGMLSVSADVHTVAWVPKMAYSGAAMVSLACREIVMGRQALLGDSQPIVGGVDGAPKPVGEKFESPLRSWFRTAAETNGYPAVLAEAMVSERMPVLRVRAPGGAEHFLRAEDYRAAEEDAELVPGVSKRELEQVGAEVVRQGELLTMTSQEARDHGFVKRSFDGGAPADEEALLAVLRAEGGTVVQVRPSFSERASRVLLTIAGILSAIVALALLYTMWQGPGFVTLGGAIALGLIVLISATADQLNGFPIFLIVLGVALLAAELFFFPGFAIPGFLGLTSLATGLMMLTSVSSDGGFEGISGDVLLSFGLQFVATVLVGLVALFLLGRFIPKIGPGRRMVLAAPDGATAPTAASDPALPPVGAQGIAQSALRPAGTAEIDGALVDVVSVGSFIDAGTRVRVVGMEGSSVQVEEAAS